MICIICNDDRERSSTISRLLTLTAQLLRSSNHLRRTLQNVRSHIRLIRHRTETSIVKTIRALDCQRVSRVRHFIIGEKNHDYANNVHGPAKRRRAKTHSQRQHVAHWRLRESSPLLPPPIWLVYPYSHVPTAPKPRDILRPLPTALKYPHYSFDRNSGAPCFSGTPPSRPFHPRPHPTLWSSRESFFLTSHPLLVFCGERNFFFFFFYFQPSLAPVLLPFASSLTSSHPRSLHRDTRACLCRLIIWRLFSVLIKKNEIHNR